MRHRVWTGVVALGLGLALATLARADDEEAKPAKTGNWITRLFSRDSASKKKTEPPQKDEAAVPPAPSAALQHQKAYWEWQRRLEVVYKLKQIALDTGDAELDRKADALDQRAWEIYLQRTGGARSGDPVEELSGLGSEAQRSASTPSSGVDLVAGSTTAGTQHRAPAGRE